MIPFRPRPPSDVSLRSATSGPDDLEAPLSRAAALLERRRGERWRELPADLGRPVAIAERLLIEGPARVDPNGLCPAQAVAVAAAALATAETVTEETSVLGAVFATDLARFDLARLAVMTAAVRHAGTVRAGRPRWAHPAAAEAAHVVLEAIGEELRTTAALHTELFTGFTDRVLTLPEARVRSAARRGRLLARWRVRSELRASSRTGRLPQGARRGAAQLLTVLEARRRLDEVSPLLTSHLGPAGWGPLTDVPALLASLAAIRALQQVLGADLDAERLERLLAADALGAPEVTLVIERLEASLEAWRAALPEGSSFEPSAWSPEALAAWAVEMASVAPALRAGVDALASLDAVPGSVRALVDDLLLRERVSDESRAEQADAARHAAAAASGETS